MIGYDVDLSSRGRVHTSTWKECLLARVEKEAKIVQEREARSPFGVARALKQEAEIALNHYLTNAGDIDEVLIELLKMIISEPLPNLQGELYRYVEWNRPVVDAAWALLDEEADLRRAECLRCRKQSERECFVRCGIRYYSLSEATGEHRFMTVDDLEPYWWRQVADIMAPGLERYRAIYGYDSLCKRLW
jgi:hemolysin-activating ACP:hemolysin acyltransferase